MPAIFTLPKQVVLGGDGVPLPAARVYFFQTGTSTPQNTYQDEALTTPHSNPVVADSSGILPVIYFDGSLPDYRVRVSSSSDVQQYQVDNIPSAQDAGSTFRLTSAAPEIIFNETDAASGNRRWRWRVNSEQMVVQIGNDAESVWTTVLSIDRTGTTTNSVVIGDAGTDVTIGGIIDTTGGALGVTGAVISSTNVTAGGSFINNSSGDNTGRGWAVCRRKSAATARSSIDVPTNDPDLAYAIPSAGTYEIQIFATFWGTTTGTQGLNANVNFSGTVGTGSSVIRNAYVNGSSLSTTLNAVSSTTSAISYIAADVSTTPYADGLLWTGVLVASTTGTVAFAWSQEASAANATNVGAGSYLKVTRLS